MEAQLSSDWWAKQVVELAMEVRTVVEFGRTFEDSVPNLISKLRQAVRRLAVYLGSTFQRPQVWFKIMSDLLPLPPVDRSARDLKMVRSSIITTLSSPTRTGQF